MQPIELTFLDHNFAILDHLKHGDDEKRYYCPGEVAGVMMTVIEKT